MPHTRRTVLLGAVPALASAAESPQAVVQAPVDAIVDRAARAHSALMAGDLGSYRELVQTAPDFTLMSPFGGRPTRGAELTQERWDSIGRFFRQGRDSTLELVQAYGSSDMVALAVIERAHVAVGGLAGQDWALRVTLVFRREKGQWLLAHRHADPLVEGISLDQAAALGGRRAA